MAPDFLDEEESLRGGVQRGLFFLLIPRGSGEDQKKQDNGDSRNTRADQQDSLCPQQSVKPTDDRRTNDSRENRGYNCVCHLCCGPHLCGNRIVDIFDNTIRAADDGHTAQYLQRKYEIRVRNEGQANHF